MKRNRSVPMITAILGESFGGSSWYAAVSDFVVQIRGTCMAVSSPRVIEIATGEKVDFEDLGGVEVHAQFTGQLDLVAEDEIEAFSQIRAGFRSCHRTLNRFLLEQFGTKTMTPAMKNCRKMVPKRRNRGYDMRRVIPRLTDDGTFLELRPQYGPSLITALGASVGVLSALSRATRIFLLARLMPLAVIRRRTSPVCVRPSTFRWSICKTYQVSL